MYKIKVGNDERTFFAEGRETVFYVLRENGISLDAPCGGKGTCGKCKVYIDGQEQLACQTVVDRDMHILLPEKAGLNILHAGISYTPQIAPNKQGYLAAFDIGSTSIVCFLLDGKSGQELANASTLNPQTNFGADVISRIQAALGGKMSQLRDAVQGAMTDLLYQVCAEKNIDPMDINLVSVVGNPAMQQLFMDIFPQNLAEIPFAPVLTEVNVVPAKIVLPIVPNAELLVIPDISGYVGADTMGCILSTAQYRSEEVSLIVDIGTNGEMVLGNQERMIACSTAAGPALEGANIQFGMRGTDGAIDHVWAENGHIRCSVIGGGNASGICGSGLIDAIAVFLDLGLINKRGKILAGDTENGQRIIRLTETIYLTQDDIRQVQLSKGAIYAGIELMCHKMGIQIEAIQHLYLAGAFGNYLNPTSACRIGLLPEQLLDRVVPVGNAAGTGAKMLACDSALLTTTQELIEKIEFLELASLPEFSKTFAKSMLFREDTL